MSECQPLVLHGESQRSPKAAVYLIGGLMIIVAILALAVQQEVMQSAESKGTVDKPSLTIWFNHAGLVLALPIGLLLQYRQEGSASPLRFWQRLLEHQDWSALKAISLGTGLSLVFFVPNLAWAVTLKSIWVPLVTAASRFDSVFVLLIGSLVSRKAPPWRQVLSVLACIGGVILISLGQHDPSSGKRGGTGPWQYAEVFISPCLAALYSIMFNWFARNVAEDPISMCALLGLIGLCNTFTLWPVVPICEVAGLEHQRLQSVFTIEAVWSMLLNAALATLGNFMQMPAVALTSPLFVALGMLLLMPVTVLIDWLVMRHTSLNAALICGSLAICCGSGYSIMTEASDSSTAPPPTVAKAAPAIKAATVERSWESKHV